MSAVVVWVLIAAAGLISVAALVALVWRAIASIRHYRTEETSET
ncbi:hypothetical protein [Tessaracoccus caeni]|nr:hypothetical protein [Tessaracoccus caeni]MDF1487773.1 hypothetical protein [Tessaracoccus caeni]